MKKLPIINVKPTNVGEILNKPKQTSEMKTDLKPTDKEYIEAAKNIYCGEDKNERSGFDAGYQLALEHTNHAELVEAAKNVLIATTEMNREYFLAQLEKALTKSETSKL